MTPASHSICIIVPYFGRLPAMLPLWLASCRRNPDVIWLLFTDDRTPYDYPPNVLVEYTTCAALRAVVAERLQLPILLETGWDFCRFRPAYGHIFAGRLAAFRWWGYCDLDVIFGSLRTFLTDEVLDSHDKILFLGHLSLYRNDPAINLAYMDKTIDGEILYERAFTKGDVSCFDEVGINRILERQGRRIYRAVVFADFAQRSFLFRRLYLPGRIDPSGGRQVFTWKDGILRRHFLTPEGAGSEELLYIHFCRRRMTLSLTPVPNIIEFAMIPNQFVDCPAHVDPDFILRNTRNRIYWSYWLPRLHPRRILRRLLWQVALVREP
jgi:hypothetical protein